MKIEISNYNNIPNLIYEPQDNKINFIFGISGAGKSSIATALCNSDYTTHVKVGEKLNNVKVLLNGQPVDSQNIFKFDISYIENILINKIPNNDVYKVIYANEDKIKQARENYKNAISFLDEIKDEVVTQLNSINILKNNLKLNFKTNGELTASSPISKVAKNASSIISCNYSTKDIKWINTGVSMPDYSKHICPFCKQNIDNQTKINIEKVLKIDKSSYEKVINETPYFDALSIQLPNWDSADSIKLFTDKLKSALNAGNDLNILYQTIQANQSLDFDIDAVKTLAISNDLKQLFPNISLKAKLFNDKIDSIKLELGTLKAKTDAIIRGNINQINQALIQMGIPYYFVKEEINEDNKTAGYILVHVKDNSKADMSKNLSFGEQNAFGLLLFLLSKKDAKILIIDDPASSYDDFRRKTLLDFIYSTHEQSTVLVLSHDAIFAKYAVFYLYKSKHKNENHACMSILESKYLNDTGNIDFLESYDELNFKQITCRDFVPIELAVINHLKELKNYEMNYRNALTLRLIFETEKYSASDVDKATYGYLSAIIHKEDYAQIIQRLNDLGIIEQKILDNIYAKTQIKFSLLKENYLNKIDFSQYTLFEKAIAVREIKTTDSTIISELNNIVHLNQAYAISLNPFKFNYFSKFVYDSIKTIDR